jgi:SAM-dependent methyltransferase
MTLKTKLARWKRKAIETVLPPVSIEPALDAARAEAAEVWHACFAPFAPAVNGADVLEVGCRDGLMLAQLIETARPRSAVGIDRVAAWDGQAGGVSWPWRIWEDRLRLLAGSGQLDQIEADSLDLILCRDLTGAFTLTDLEAGLSRLYDALRPGGEMLVRATCASVSGGGYGFMTPTAWAMIMMCTGFEIADMRRTWRDPADQAALAPALAWTGETEALAGDVTLRLLRPWETDELAGLVKRGSRRKRK